jgi:hypothetical protein
MATPAISQTTTQIARTDNQKQVKRDVAPLPNDPLELATGPTATVTTPQQRLAVTKLLQQARRNMVLHAIGERPFTLKLSFTSSGHPRYTGSGELEEAWANGQSWRWSAQLGDYSQQRVFSDGFAYDVKSPGAIPLRFQMIRSAVFNAMPIRPPQGLMRVATAKWQGTDLMCVLLSGPNNDPAPTPGRRWVETEHCVDPTTGLLHLWSEAPGIYVVYNYADALHFHGKTVPRQISVVEGGTQVLDIHVDSLEDGAGDPALLKPTPDMLANGPGTLMERVMRFPQFIRNVPKGASEIKVEPVIVHAIIDEHGKVIDAEALQNTNPTLSQTAVKFVEDSTYPHQAPGTVPRQREAFINVRFATGG